MTRKRRARRMSSVLSGLGGPDCFATEADWAEYQTVLTKLKIRSLEQVMDGDEIQPVRQARKPYKRKKTFDRRTSGAL